jgi:hypothetical protein
VVVIKANVRNTRAIMDACAIRQSSTLVIEAANGSTK